MSTNELMMKAYYAYASKEKKEKSKGLKSLLGFITEKLGNKIANLL